MTRSEIPLTAPHKNVKVLEFEYRDVYGPIETLSKEGAKYFMTSIDQVSKWTTSYPIKSNAYVFPYVQKFVVFAGRGTGFKLKTFQTDGGD